MEEEHVMSRSELRETVQRTARLRDMRGLQLQAREAHEHTLAKLVRLTKAEALMQELLQSDIHMGTNGVLYEHMPHFRDHDGQKHMRHAGLKWCAEGEAIDPGQPEFFEKLVKAVTEKRLVKRRAETEHKTGTGTGRTLDDIIRKGLAKEIEKELWNGVPTGENSIAPMGGNHDNYR